MLRIGLFADVDLNMVDGSSLWVQSMAESIHRHTLYHCVVLSKNSLQLSRPIPRALQSAGIEVSFPGGVNSQFSHPLERVLDQKHVESLGLDILLVRGLRANIFAIEAEVKVGQYWGYVTEFDRSVVYDDKTINALRLVNKKADRMIVQTAQARDVLTGLPDFDLEKLIELPPMIQTQYFESDLAGERKRRIVYGGKFAPEWGILELGDFVSQCNPTISAYIFGDKIHDPTDGIFTSQLEMLRASPQLDWRGAVSRSEVVRHLLDSNFSWAWRSPALEDKTLELSSKLIEACAVGCLPICYPNQQNRQLLGADYPLFVTNPQDFGEVVERISTWTEERVVSLRQMLRERVAVHESGRVLKNLFTKLIPTDVLPTSYGRIKAEKENLLVAGHDLKFASGIIRSLGFSFHIEKEQWKGHRDPDISSSLPSPRHDVIWCEWALGNAVHYSHNKHPHQRLYIRFHLQEFSTEFPEEIDISNVDRVVFVNDFHKRQAGQKYGWPAEKLVTIPNYLSTVGYFQEKPADAYFNICMIGIAPARKRLDRALDLIESLREKDDRWRLWIKGARPEHYAWLKSRPDEMAYYTACEQRAQSSSLIRNGVTYVGPGPDVPQFLRNMGWVLSPSDFESFHLAIVEGAAAGCLPIIWKWDAAPSLYDADLLVDSTEEAAAKIVSVSDEQRREKADRIRRDMIDQFDLSVVSGRFLSLFTGDIERQ